MAEFFPAPDARPAAGRRPPHWLTRATCSNPYIGTMATCPGATDIPTMTTYQARLGIFGAALFAIIGVIVFRVDLILDLVAKLH